MNNDNFEAALAFLNDLSQGKKEFANIDLTGTVLERLTAPKGCSLQGAIFQSCRLNFAVMNACNLKAAIFDQAELEGAIMTGSNCQRSTFQGANLSRVNFMKSRLLNANLRKANLQGANLSQADVRGVDFRGAILIQTEFRGAFYDDNTTFDPGIDPSSLGMRFVEESRSETGAAKLEKSGTPKKNMMYRGAPVATTDSGATASQKKDSKAKKSVIMYRGVPIETSEENESQPGQASQNSPRTYRGVRVNY